MMFTLQQHGLLNEDGTSTESYSPDIAAAEFTQKKVIHTLGKLYSWFGDRKSRLEKSLYLNGTIIDKAAQKHQSYEREAQ